MGGRGKYAKRRKMERKQHVIKDEKKKIKKDMVKQFGDFEFEVIHRGQIDQTEGNKFRTKMYQELPPSTTWKHPSGRDIAEAAIDVFSRSPLMKGIIVAREAGTSKFRGITAFTPERTGYVYIDYLSGTGGGTGTELIKSVIRENPGKGIQLTALSTARTYYQSIGMHSVSGYLGFEPQEAALFLQYGKEWKSMSR